MRSMASVFVLSVLIPGPLSAEPPKPEPWADTKLPVQAGLSLCLDASRQVAAWQANGRLIASSKQLLDVWYDGSGSKLDFNQTVADAQPRLIRAGERAAVRFDGADDVLSRVTGLSPKEELTLFLVVAPRSNAGFFRAILSANALGKNDYVTGFNLDMGPEATTDRFRWLNIEGPGFGGAKNLITGTGYPYGSFQTIAVEFRSDPAVTQIYINGEKIGKRDRQLASLHLDNLTIGARCYSNDGAKPPFVSGFLNGDIAEILLFDRALSAEERDAVEAYLSQKHEHLGQDLATLETADGHMLRPVENPPIVQMLVPGFEVHELPLDLTNMNSVRYRPDGKAFAVAYNGNAYILTDTDNDGLEDKATLWWESKGRMNSPIGMALTPTGYTLGNGILVASQGNVRLLLESEEGKEPREVVVADGWKPLQHSVDAMGVAFDKDANIYFGLGTQDFTNGHLVDASGKAHYDLSSERGTISKVSADLKHRAIVCTGIRFPVSLAFNRAGDLFATDQEGATWLPNGNPFDELLHIQPGRHYGFPPRHPKHLPNVIDEPSVYDYTPQHQSTCGLFFNEPVNGGPVFGPTSWQGDAIVCGESRGKLYRTSLVKTATGYVAKNQLIASLGMLAIDSCVTPQGDLLVACHGGSPDWGNGPSGKGKLFKIRYRGDQPQPVASWPAGPGEIRIAFDKPLDPESLKGLTERVSVEYGKYVSAGDRFETHRPGYAVVAGQMETPRYDLPVLSVQVSKDRRTLVLKTPRQVDAVSYAVTLPKLTPVEPSSVGIIQTPEIDLAYDLTGCEAIWTAILRSTTLSTWLPHVDLAVSRAFTGGSAEQEALWNAVQTPGSLVLRTQLDLWQMLRPKVQPGSTLDYVPDAEEVTLHLVSNLPFNVKCAGVQETVSSSTDQHSCNIALQPEDGKWIDLEVELPTGEKPLELSVSFSTKEDPRRRSLPLRRMVLPWASALSREVKSPTRREIPELVGGSWLRGKKVFEKEACGKCHRVRGQGHDIGPDLSNLVHRDYASVLRDIREPNRALNPDYIAQTVSLTDGRILTGTIRSREGRMILGDADGRETVLNKDEIESIRASTLSIMPADLEKTLGPERLKDLLTYLLTAPPLPAPLERPDAPPPRSRAEVDAVLQSVVKPQEALEPLKIVLCAGPKDHGPDEHDYPLWQRRWMNLLSLAEGALVSEAESWPNPSQWNTADLIVFYSANPSWNAEKAKDIDPFLARGGGLVFIHFAVNGGPAPMPLAERIGLAWQNGSRFRHGPLELTLRESTSGITRGMTKLSLIDESYWNLAGDAGGIELIGKAPEEGDEKPLLWTQEKGKGRVFVSIPGHYTWTFDDPLFRLLLLRGMSWAASQPVDRLSELATIGARIDEGKP